MKVSDDIAKINADRFKNWNKPNQQEKRAIFLFEGDVFKNLNAKGMSEEDSVSYTHLTLPTKA